MAMTCAGDATGSSPSSPTASSLSRVVSRSERRRELVNTRVEVVPSMSSSTARSTCGHTDGVAASSSDSGPGGLARSSTGTVTRTSNCFSEGGITTLTGVPARRKDANVSTGLTVAEQPMRWTRPPFAATRCSSLSRLRAR